MGGDKFRRVLITAWEFRHPNFSDETQYCIYQMEQCPESGKYHLQIFQTFKKSVSMKHIKEMWGNNCHIEKCRGNNTECKNYCSKDESRVDGPWEYGTMIEQGERTDLNALKDDIFNGKRVDDITLDNPMIFHQYGRTLNKLEDLAMRKKFRTEMTQAIWYWGPTGVGKSHKAFENFTPETHYVFPNDGGWWDAYTQQDIVIMNDFRGELSYNYLLDLIDKYPINVKRRNREPMPFLSKMIIITSSLPPELIYKNRDKEDSLEQLLRRCQVVHIPKKESAKAEEADEVVGGNTSAPTLTQILEKGDLEI